MKRISLLLALACAACANDPITPYVAADGTKSFRYVASSDSPTTRGSLANGTEIEAKLADLNYCPNGYQIDQVAAGGNGTLVYQGSCK